MPRDLKDLGEAFAEVNERFTHGKGNPDKPGDYGPLVDMMTDDVVVKRVRAPASLIGKPAVTKYLGEEMSIRNCDFDNVHKRSTWVNQKSTYAVVSGVGIYHDDDNDINERGKPVLVTFAWCFTRPSDTYEWKLVNVFGAPAS